MAIHPAYAQVSALLAAVFILIAGNGLSNTLIPLSATAAAFPPLSIGVIASAYFGGMFVGCIAAPRIIARAGHIRAFSAFVAIATVTTLLHPMFVDPTAWAAIRAVTGFCFAGLYATIESWMHDKADNVVAVVQQTPRDVKTNEAGRAGNQYRPFSHPRLLSSSGPCSKPPQADSFRLLAAIESCFHV